MIKLEMMISEPCQKTERNSVLSVGEKMSRSNLNPILMSTNEAPIVLRA